MIKSMRTILNISVFPVLILLITISCGKNQKSSNNEAHSLVADTGKAVITFTEYEHNFGRVESGEKVACFFSYENAGTGNLVINSVSASCGCTVPKYNKKPLAPGENGTLEVVFNTAGYSGLQTKSITVHSNAEQPVVLIRIMAEVVNEL